MDRDFFAVMMRHRSTVKDGSLILLCVAFLASFAFAFDLAEQRFGDSRIDLDELLLLGLVLGAGVAWFGWRRILEQERQILAKTEAECRAEFLAHHDHLTGLPNRRRFQKELQAVVETPPRVGRTHALLLLDLNGFKKINDIYGHASGDKVLSVVADRLANALSHDGLLARTGGDEFAVILRDLPDVAGGDQIAERIITSLQAPIRTGSDEHVVGAGIGIALIPSSGVLFKEVMRRADVALYRAKALVEPAYLTFQDEMDNETRQRDLMQQQLAVAVAAKSIVPFYQPIVDLETGQVRAFEALARWSNPTFGAFPPDQFIPLAEDCGLIKALSDHLLNRACIDALAWPSDIGLSFNISPKMLRDRTLGLKILNILGSSGLSPKRLELEITETAISQDFEQARESLELLRCAGVKIVLDDFGTGATSLAHLRSFKFDGLKIDRRFVNLMLDESESSAIVRSILGLARGLGLTIVAEGVEQAAQRAALQKEGCLLGQGFHFSRAVPSCETGAFFGHNAPAAFSDQPVPRQAATPL